MDLYFIASYHICGSKCIGIFILHKVDNKFYLRWKWSTSYKDRKEILPCLPSHFYFINEGWSHNEYVEDFGFSFDKRYLKCVMSKEDLNEHLLCG